MERRNAQFGRLFSQIPTPKSQIHKKANGLSEIRVFFDQSGEGGIRTPGTLAGTTVFKTAAFNRSATSPENKIVRFKRKG